MIRLELVFSEMSLSSVATVPLLMEAYRPGSASQTELRHALEAVLRDRPTCAVSKVERVATCESRATWMQVERCPVRRGAPLCERGLGCTVCREVSPLRAELCHRIWPNQQMELMEVHSGS